MFTVSKVKHDNIRGSETALSVKKFIKGPQACQNDKYNDSSNDVYNHLEQRPGIRKMSLFDSDWLSVFIQSILKCC